MNVTNGSNSTVHSTLVFAIPNPYQDPIQRIVFTLLSLILIFVALSCNSFIILSLLKKSPVSPTNHIIINLCVADIVKCVVFFATYNVPIFYGSWQLGRWPCKILPGLYMANVIFSISILACLFHQRYDVVARPLTHSEVTRAKVYFVIVINWFCNAFPLIFAVSINNKVHQIEGEARCAYITFGTDTEGPQGYVLGRSIGILTLVTIFHFRLFFYYVRIRRLLQVNSKMFSENNVVATSQRIERNKKATNTVLASVVAYDLIVTPGLALVTVGLVGYKVAEQLSVLQVWGELWLLVHSCVNPVLFIWRNDELKSAWKRFVNKERRSNIGACEQTR